uniref:SFRICE_009785 n=1 Tax=Spodoptera frugiperda TaxID=7108 RepID=A0A2H1VB01_SPOFR
MIVGVLYKCLIARVCVVEECYGKYDENGQCEVITAEKIQGWVERYRGLSNCGEKITLCFGRLKTRTTDYNKFIVIFAYVSIMIMPLTAGQMTRNQGVKFHRVLARLYNKMIGTDANAQETKMIKDFIRLIKKNPLQIKLISNFPAGMNLLPAIVMLFFNYLIVILQFNHVI